MGTNYLAILGVTTMTTVMSCSSAKKEYASYELYPVRSGNLVEMEYAPGATRFTLWAPTADVMGPRSVKARYFPLFFTPEVESDEKSR